MPNGGSDCCGTCCFNRKNSKEIPENQSGDSEKDFCVIRNIPIECSFWTYCVNHPHHNPERIDITIGPVYVCGEDSYKRVVSLKSPDTEEIRLKLIELAEKIREQPVMEYSAGVYLDEAIVMQLGEFKEKRAIDALRRIINFNPEARAGNRTRASLVKVAGEALGKIMYIPFIDLDEVEIDPELARAIPEHLARRYKVIPVAWDNNTLALAMVDPLNVVAIDEIRLKTGFDVEPLIATEATMLRSINEHYGVFSEAEEGPEEGGKLDLDKLIELIDEPPIVKIVNLVFTQAINDKASDIYITPGPEKTRVSYMIDGVLHDVMKPPGHIHEIWTARIKSMADMNISEKKNASGR